jgi:hypothetical protein
MPITVATRFKDRKVFDRSDTGIEDSYPAQAMLAAFFYVVLKLEGNKPLRRPRHRWENNIKVYIKGMGCEGMHWIHLVQDRYQSRAFCEHGNEPKVP